MQNPESELDYWQALRGEIESELDAFDKYIFPIFSIRGFSRSDALQFYSNRRVEESVDELIDRVDNSSNDSSESEPWKD